MSVIILRVVCHLLVMERVVVIVSIIPKGNFSAGMMCGRDMWVAALLLQRKRNIKYVKEQSQEKTSKSNVKMVYKMQ